MCTALLNTVILLRADAAKIRFALQESQSVMALFPDFFLRDRGTVAYHGRLLRQTHTSQLDTHGLFGF